MKKRILWTDINLNFEDWEEELKEEYPELDEDELIQKMYEINSDYLYDIRDNLNIQLSQPIIVLGDLELWNKRVKAVKIIKSGNIRDCFYTNTDMAEWYIDGYKNLRCEAVHHDGTNHYLYRVFKAGITESDIENFIHKVCLGTLTSNDISCYTRNLGSEIFKVYC